MKVLEKIFSVKNSFDRKHKIVIMFGIKIKFRKNIKKPYIGKNTFLLWEPCSVSHGEIIPGYANYLIDLGYEVSILMTPDRIKEGLFSRFKNKKIHLNKMSQEENIKYLQNYGIGKAKGIIITTARNASDNNSTYKDKLNLFEDKSKVLLVEHEVKPPIDNGFWQSDIITLSEIDYKNKSSIVINPHYFGNIKVAPKNNITEFLAMGVISPTRRNYDILFNAVRQLKNENLQFKVKIMGKGNLELIEDDIEDCFAVYNNYFDYYNMYDSIERADFILSLLDENNPTHDRYITTGTSGTYQLVYGFLKPCIIGRKFCKNKFLDDNNSITYNGSDLLSAMRRAIKMDGLEYKKLQDNLKANANKIYKTSLSNLKDLIKDKNA